MRRPVAIKLQNPERWQRDNRWILASCTRTVGRLAFKFCYEPSTGRLWLGSGSQSHKEVLNVKTGRTLDQVVRGIYFRAQHIIYLRYCENEKWLRETAAMLRFYGMPSDHCIAWGAGAAEKLRHLLDGL